MMENKLPKGWDTITLKELCNMVYGKGLLTKFLTDEGYPVYGANGIIGKYTSYIYKEPQVIISCRGAACGVIHKTVPFSYITSNSIVLALKSTDINLEYFKKSIMSVEKSKIITGSAQPQITIENLNELEIPIAPFSEQNRIVSKLDAVMQKVESNKERLEKIPKILKRFRQSVLAAATSGRLTEDWREKNGIVDEWVEKTLRQLSTKLSYGSSQKSELSGKIPVLRMGNIQEGKLAWGDLKYSSDEAEIKKYWLENGDVLFNRTNSPELVGKTAIYRGEQPAIYAGYIIKIKTTNKLNPEYLNLCLNTLHAREWCNEVKTDGVSQSNINAQKLADLTIQTPTIEEQQEIVRQVEKLFAFADKLEARYAKAKAMLDKLPQSILAKAFRGELVPQDPNDEPASVLLERIRKEKEGENKKRK